MDSASRLVVIATFGVCLVSLSARAADKQQPLHRTAYFAGQAGWGPESTASPPPSATNFDRYANPPAEIVDRTRQAVIESGNSLRDGVEQGIQAANQQLYQGTENVINATRAAGQDLNQQFQGWAGTTTQQVQQAASSAMSGTAPTSRSQVTSPFASAPPAASAPATTGSRNAVAPPPWSGGAATAAPGWSNEASAAAAAPRTAALGAAAPTQTSSGWTSVHSSVAPPAMPPPQLLNTAGRSQPVNGVAPVASQFDVAPAGNQQLQPLAGSSGPGFPATISAGNQSTERSMLAQQNQQQLPAPPANDNWALGWDGNKTAQQSNAVDAGRYVNTTAATAAAAANQPAGSPGVDPWAEKDPWMNQRLAAQPAQSNAGATIAVPTAGNAAAQPGIGGMPQQSPQTSFAAAPTQQFPQVAAPAATTVPAANQPPWMPLLVVSLSLAGSIGANLFLGWSYVDARQRYRHLVQKTANKFRRATIA